jgi:hypothetical protein
MAFQRELPSKSALFANPRKNQQNSVVSLNGSFQLILHRDGNLALHEIANRGQTTIWASNKKDPEVNKCIMQPDGNLVIYTKKNHVIWASNTNGHPGSHLEIRDDGHAVIFTRDGIPIWSKPEPER